MKNLKNTLRIQRRDFVNLNKYGYPIALDTVTDFNSTKIEEVQEICYDFETKEEAIMFAGKFPKSYLAKITKGNARFLVTFYFNVFYTNKSTGEINESALKRREKVISKLKEYNLI